ncbi:MAG: disulfide reductase [candidate division Zixibacteria bacterium RBG_16_53_22]|nr:MAG: disulfide reductase [candidate division Zixibacteria bacterium RBG_16_53_22]
MSYLYYPGCSLKGLGRAYEESLLAVFSALSIDLKELPDWNCCGATAYMSIDETRAFALSTRNLALAEKCRVGEEMVHLITPCSGCYLVLTKAQHYTEEYEDLHKDIEIAMNSVDLKYNGKVRVRHPLDVLINDIGIEYISSQVSRPLKGIKVACYYGCQIVRPFSSFDDQHQPTSMERLMKTLGAEVIEWPLKTRCCGGSLAGTVEDVGLRLSYILLKEAQKRHVDVIATVCPLCQFNLECYQPRIGRKFRDKIDMPVMYFTQLMGMALGLGKKELGMQRLTVPFPQRAALEKMGGHHVGR